jgi:hypothetical protein
LKRRLLSAAAPLLALALLDPCAGGADVSDPPPRLISASPAASDAVRVQVRWDPATGRGDVIHHLAGGDLLRTCFQCTYAGYTGGLAIGSEGGSGMALYPRRPTRGYREINVWCAQDESIWDRDDAVEYSWGWSENFGRGDDGRRLEYEGGQILEAGPARVALRTVNAGGCYRVTRVATTRAGARWWVLATRVTNRCPHPVRFDFYSGEDPWIGRYRSSDGDVGWTPSGLVRHEAAFAPGELEAGGLYDLGNSALGQTEGTFSNQANAYVLDPAAPLPDVALFANAFAHDPADVDPARPLDNQSLTALNLGWRDRVLAPGEGLTVAFAMGMAETGEPGATPRPPTLDDADWSIWRAHLPTGPRAAEGDAVRFAAERVELDLDAAELRVDGLYTVRNPGAAAATLVIRYPILVAPDRPAPTVVDVDGRPLTPAPDAPDGDAPATVSVRFPVPVPAHGIARFRVRYTQPHRARTAAYLVTSARTWPTPLERAVFVVRHPATLGDVQLSYAGGSVRRQGDAIVHTVARRDFRPAEELVVHW